MVVLIISGLHLKIQIKNSLQTQNKLCIMQLPVAFAGFTYTAMQYNFRQIFKKINPNRHCLGIYKTFFCKNENKS
jgi:hypothetical protein